LVLEGVHDGLPAISLLESLDVVPRVNLRHQASAGVLRAAMGGSCAYNLQKTIKYLRQPYIFVSAAPASATTPCMAATAPLD